MHQAAISNGSQKKRQSQIEAENARAQIAVGECNGVTRAKGDVIVNTAIFAQCNFALGPAIQIVKDRTGDASLRNLTEVGNADDARGRYGARG
jgi:hypothetical protein